MTMTNKVNRFLLGFDKKSGRLAHETPLPTSVSLKELQARFNVPRSNPMYDCFRIEAAQAAWICGVLNMTLDMKKMDYFLEADAQSTLPSQRSIEKRSVKS